MLLSLEKVNKEFSQGERKVKALDNFDLELQETDFIAIVGPSGCGKSTLLKTLACLIKPDSGKFIYNFEDTSKWSESKKAAYRNSEVGIVVQDYALLENQTVQQNMRLPFAYSSKSYSRSEKNSLIEKALLELGVSELLKTKVKVLSGGQKQRVAIARAIVMKPKLLLADEPTGALDSKNSAIVFELLRKINSNGTAVIIATHNLELAECSDKIIEIVDGKIVEIRQGSN